MPWPGKEEIMSLAGPSNELSLALVMIGLPRLSVVVVMAFGLAPFGTIDWRTSP